MWLEIKNYKVIPDSIGFLRNINVTNEGQDFSLGADRTVLEILPSSIPISGKFYLEINRKENLG